MSKKVLKGVQDDRVLVHWPTDPVSLLKLAKAHGARFQKVNVYPNKSLSKYVDAVARAKREGMWVHALIAENATGRHLGPAEFASWARQTAQVLGDAGVTSFGVLNEPDLTIRVTDACKPRRAIAEVKSHGWTVRKVKKTRRVPKTRKVRVRTISKDGRERWIVKRVPVYRVVGRKTRLKGRWIVRKVLVQVMRRRTSMTESLVRTTSTTREVRVSAVQGCRKINRARIASVYYRLAVPAIRQVVPKARIILGDTSPVGGSELFLAEMKRLKVPKFEGWSHHPYPGPIGLRLHRSAAMAALVRGAFGDIPIYFHEFGIHARNGVVHEEATRSWKKLFETSCSLGINEIVAYQLQPSPPGPPQYPVTWDTGLFGLNDAETESSSAFASGGTCSKSPPRNRPL